MILSAKVRHVSIPLIPYQNIDIGEIECLALYQELNADYLLIDDKKAREIAEMQQIKCIGTLTLIFNGKQKGYLTNIRPIFEALLKNRRFYAKAILNFFLNKAGENLL